MSLYTRLVSSEHVKYTSIQKEILNMGRRYKRNLEECQVDRADLCEIMKELEFNQELFNSATDEAEGIDSNEYLSPLERQDTENIKRRNR